MQNDWEVSCDNDVNDQDHHVDEEDDDHDDEVYPESNAESHLSLAFLDIDEKSTVYDSVDVNQKARLSLEGYLRGRWSLGGNVNSYV